MKSVIAAKVTSVTCGRIARMCVQCAKCDVGGLSACGRHDVAGEV